MRLMLAESGHKLVKGRNADLTLCCCQGLSPHIQAVHSSWPGAGTRQRKTPCRRCCNSLTCAEMHCKQSARLCNLMHTNSIWLSRASERLILSYGTMAGRIAASQDLSLAQADCPIRLYAWTCASSELAALLLAGKVPVAILGAGPTGLTLSVLLSGLGIQHAVFEANSAITQHPQVSEMTALPFSAMFGNAK